MFLNAKHVTTITMILIWTVTSFCCQKCAEVYLRIMGDNSTQGVIALTFSQLFMCFSSLKIRCNRQRQTVSKHNLVIAYSHALATLSTNYSLSVIPASSTFTIKMFEPITSAILLHIVKVQKPRSSMIASLCVIITGAILFNGNPFRDGVFLSGICHALISNLALPIRNTALKAALKDGVIVHSTYALVALVFVPCTAFSFSLLSDQVNILHGTLLISTSSLFHTLYTYISIGRVLPSVTLVTHAVINVVKRVTVVVLLCAFGHRSLTGFNYMGLFVTATGLVLYGKTRRSTAEDIVKAPEKRNPYRAKTGFILVVLTFVAMTAPIVHNTYSQLNVHDGENSSTNQLIVSARGPYQNNNSTITLARNVSGILKIFAPILRKDNLNLKGDIKDDTFEKSKNETFELPEEAKNRFVLKMTTFDDVIAGSQRAQLDVLGPLLNRFRYVVLTDIAVHENKGDAAISVGELLLLKKLKKEIIFYCNTYACSEHNMQAGLEKAYLHGVKNVVVLCHGGGNLVGYRQHDTLRARVFEIFRDFERIVLPQSIWLQSQSQLNDTKTVLRRHHNVTLLLRDSFSLKTAQKHFPLNKIYLAPDSAFQIGHVNRTLRPFYDILWLRRTDVEKAHYNLPTFPPNISVSVKDWLSWHTAKSASNIENAFLIATNGFNFLQRGRVVITDRLHGHIMCILLHVPHVLLDTTDHKISKYLNTWTKGLQGKKILTAKTPQDAIQKAVFLLEKYGGSIPSVENWMSLRENIERI